MRSTLLALATLLVLAACDSSRPPALPLVWEDAPFAVALEPDVKYGEGESRSGPNLDLRLDVYSPLDSASAPRAAMLLVHGGSWIIGDKANPRQVALANYFAARGLVVFSINYRMVGDDPPDAPQWWTDFTSLFLDEATVRASYAAMVDTATAVRFIRANAEALGVSPDHVFGSGASAGAFNVAHVGLDDPEAYLSALTMNNPGVSSALQLIVDHWGGFFRLAQVDPLDPPVLIFHGTEDTTAPYALGQRLDESLTAAAVPHEFYPLEGQGHSAWDALIDGRRLEEVTLDFILMHGNVRAATASSSTR